MFKKSIISLSIALLVSFASMTSAGEGEGITCISKGTYETAEYDKGTNGRDVRTNIRVGQNYKIGQCMGRCGGGCDKWWAASAWAKDCLDHDICIVDQNGENDLANDENCGDEFNQAADDYAFGVWRGCSG